MEKKGLFTQENKNVFKTFKNDDRGESTSKLIFILASLVVTLIVVSVIFLIINVTKSKATDVLQQEMDTMTAAIEAKYTQYEGTNVTGAELVNIIRDTYQATDYANISVRTAAAASAVSYVSTPGATGPGAKIAQATFNTAMTNAQDKSNANYINPRGTFTATITRDTNGTIQTVAFVQN